MVLINGTFGRFDDLFTFIEWMIFIGGFLSIGPFFYGFL
jgi:hypothetical protein